MAYVEPAVERMFSRSIGRDDVLSVVSTGETVTEYADDTPFPSRLLLGFVDGRAIPVVVAWDAETGTARLEILRFAA